MKFPFKVGCLLLSLMLLLNGAGFAAMLGCDEECCQSSLRPASTQGTHMNCHEGEMAPGSDAVLQVENRPVELPPLNFVQCETDAPSASLVTKNTYLEHDLITPASLDQIPPQPKDHGGEPASHLSSPPSSRQIAVPLRN